MRYRRAFLVAIIFTILHSTNAKKDEIDPPPAPSFFFWLSYICGTLLFFPICWLLTGLFFKEKPKTLQEINAVATITVSESEEEEKPEPNAKIVQDPSDNLQEADNSIVI